MFGIQENPSGRFSIDEIRKATGDFNKSNIIGEGSFGRVYKGIIGDESTPTFVAVKRTLNPQSKEGIPELETEIKMLSRCKHSNLVNLLGYCNENQEMILVYEYMSNGNLADHLYRNEGSPLTWEQRLKVCIGVALGLDYLHSGTGFAEKIVHLDIKSDNILLNDNLAAKIADLGLSRIGPANQPNTQVKTNTLRGTEVYMDPEYRKTGNYSSKSDVYSFGVVLLEVLSGTCAWRGPIIPEFDRANWIQQHISKKSLNQIVDPRIVSEIQPGSLNSFLHTASKTLHLDSERRPSMSSVVAQLESALERQDEDDPFEVGYEGETSWNSVPGNAPNVFGDPIGNKQMAKMGLDRTRANRALVAYRSVTPDQDKYKKALGSLQDVVLKLRNELTKTRCLIYNATGETINYVTSCDLYGQAEPYPYPMKIHNGHWGAFQHVRNPFFSTESVGAVVYRVKYSDSAFCDHMVTWCTWSKRSKFPQGKKNLLDVQVYCEINEVGHFDVTDWDATFEKTKNAGQNYEVTWNDCVTNVSSRYENPNVLVAVLTQVGAKANVPPVSHTSTKS